MLRLSQANQLADKNCMVTSLAFKYVFRETYGKKLLRSSTSGEKHFANFRKGNIELLLQIKAGF